MTGRDEEFVEFVASRRRRLQHTAYLLCGDPHQAEDIVQAALTKLYVAWPRVRTADSVDAYARRTIINTHLSEVGRPWRRREASGLDAAGEPESRQPGVDSAIGERDDLWAALKELSPAKRRIVVLRHYWGLSVAETAADLGISQGTVKSQTHQAIAFLRNRLTTTQGSQR